MSLTQRDIEQAIPDDQSDITSESFIAKYVYKPLLEVDEIRLLRIEPGLWNSNPQCKISHHRLSHRPQFEALSYVWGSEEKPCKIDCGESRMLAVTRNCFAAIKRLRKLGSLVVWIDAVCIDQDNDLERGHQVKNMPHIYNSATKVLVYLGETEEDGDEAMEILRLYKWNLSICLDPLRRLMRRSWFERIWVLQEVNKAQHLDVICGDHIIPWDPCFRLLVKWGPENFVRQDVPYILHMRGRDGDNLQPWDLLDLLMNTRLYKCTDPRDWIFALLSMSSESSRRGIEPDYTLTVENIYIQAATQFLNRVGLDVLAIVDHGSRELPHLLPSWVPDWRTRPSCTSLIQVIDRPNVKFGGDRHYLFTNNAAFVVHGQPLGTIHDIGRIFEPDGNDLDEACIEDWWRLLSRQYPDVDILGLSQILHMDTTNNIGLFTRFRTSFRSLTKSVSHTISGFIAETGDTRLRIVEGRGDTGLTKEAVPLYGNSFLDLLCDLQNTPTLDQQLRKKFFRKNYDLFYNLYEARYQSVSYSQIMQDLKDVFLDEIRQWDGTLKNNTAREHTDRKKIDRSLGPFTCQYQEYPGADNWNSWENLSSRSAVYKTAIEQKRMDKLSPWLGPLEEEQDLQQTPRPKDRNAKHQAIVQLVRMCFLQTSKKLESYYNDEGRVKDYRAREVLHTRRYTTVKKIIEHNWDLVEPDKSPPPIDLQTRFKEPHLVDHYRILKCCKGRRLFATESFSGLVPANAQSGDLLCSLSGSSFPVLLRKVDGHEVFIGACHVIGDIESQVQDGRYFTIM